MIEPRDMAERIVNADHYWIRITQPEAIGLAEDYLRLTDPAPLTEQALRDAGFVGASDSDMWCGNVGVTTSMEWMTRRHHSSNHHDGIANSAAPRNVGELNQLLRRVNGGGA